MSITLWYGRHPDQHARCFDPPTVGSKGVAVLIHGGYWRPQFGADLMNPLANSLIDRGWAVANVEYRRVGGGGGWPTTIDDARAALERVATSSWRRRHDGPLVAIGHSVGGQLALLGGTVADHIVALAPVTDCVRTDREGLGEDAAFSFFGMHADRAPAEYAAASPIRQLPVGVPTLLVHGTEDTRVPLDHTRTYADAARRAGDRVELRVLPGVDHFQLIDPRSEAWTTVYRSVDDSADAGSERRFPTSSSRTKASDS
ncbi:MAG TPA: prolyl oligopeptidase family serine peptidase [Flexivirga sp.]|uniref:alpha/beta hydrolase family protein n=1 Tax=Flexivirga sp. TaxID=1962927 RepID=UPI002CAE0D74|nr:prolyl oligopeptidase family serine peptidase [Flexivirga sp.]HWC24590.1 prolyl oligopeptidase family serine peptidase [Flexivirga sp.]